MKNKVGRFQSFLIIGISFWVVMYPIYLHYDNLSEIDFSSPGPAFEVLDQEDFLAQEENKAKIFALRFCCAFCPLSFSLGGPFSFIPFHPPFFDQLISILRC